MDDETLDFLLSKNFQSSLRLRSDPCIGYEDEDDYGDDDDYSPEFPCPYCSEELDLVALCCHIDDEHYGEGRSGLCPVCARVGADMVGHITKNHGNILKIQHKLQVLKGEAHSALSLALRKELQDEHLKCLLEGSSRAVSSSSMDADPLLSSFMCRMPAVPSMNLQPSASTSAETSLLEKVPDENMPERKNQQPPLSDKDQEEKARKSEFVQGLLWSTIFDDNL